ncbi:MAG: CPBP family intramembrane metalloprotease [Gammaproteobacteria bacterium]|nr:CPBP family intramembrane metalloprotease [Gammaproteobacteria bacterium]MBT8105576.1 CPBP family intramembrane metalloprotease [Gammaproteobacteria bacterium]NNK25590.1 CPBP family intramembrane metalloprotease [Woeseiaceae bacterium]
MNRKASATVHSRYDLKVVGIVTLFATGLLVSGALRFMAVHDEDPLPIATYATEIYIAITVLAAILLVRCGLPVMRLGFNFAFGPLRYLALAAIGVGLIRLTGLMLEPLTEHLFGGTRDLTRFSDVAGSRSALIKLMLLNWTVAAFGEELAFRIVLMRGIAFALRDTRTAFVLALIAQAVIFGVVHAYQGPAGIIGTTINGLIFGGLTLAARGTIWPAAIAHGANNSIGIMQLYWAA